MVGGGVEAGKVSPSQRHHAGSEEELAFSWLSEPAGGDGGALASPAHASPAHLHVGIHHLCWQQHRLQMKQALVISAPDSSRPALLGRASLHTHTRAHAKIKRRSLLVYSR